MRQNQRLSSAEPLAFEGPAAKLAAPLLEKMSYLLEIVLDCFFTRPGDFKLQK
jgi:hypothetical protein